MTSLIRKVYPKTTPIPHTDPRSTNKYWPVAPYYGAQRNFWREEPTQLALSAKPFGNGTVFKGWFKINDQGEEQWLSGRATREVVAVENNDTIKVKFGPWISTKCVDEFGEEFPSSDCSISMSPSSPDAGDTVTLSMGTVPLGYVLDHFSVRYSSGQVLETDSFQLESTGADITAHLKANTSLIAIDHVLCSAYGDDRKYIPDRAPAQFSGLRFEGGVADWGFPDNSPVLLYNDFYSIPENQGWLKGAPVAYPFPRAYVISFADVQETADGVVGTKPFDVTFKVALALPEVDQMSTVLEWGAEKQHVELCLAFADDPKTSKTGVLREYIWYRELEPDGPKGALCFDHFKFDSAPGGIYQNTPGTRTPYPGVYKVWVYLATDYEIACETPVEDIPLERKALVQILLPNAGAEIIDWLCKEALLLAKPISGVADQVPVWVLSETPAAHFEAVIHGNFEHSFWVEPAPDPTTLVDFQTGILFDYLGHTYIIRTDEIKIPTWRYSFDDEDRPEDDPKKDEVLFNNPSYATLDGATIIRGKVSNTLFSTYFTARGYSESYTNCVARGIQAVEAFKKTGKNMIEDASARAGLVLGRELANIALGSGTDAAKLEQMRERVRSFDATRLQTHGAVNDDLLWPWPADNAPERISWTPEDKVTPPGFTESFQRPPVFRRWGHMLPFQPPE